MKFLTTLLFILSFYKTNAQDIAGRFERAKSYYYDGDHGTFLKMTASLDKPDQANTEILMAIAIANSKQGRINAAIRNLKKLVKYDAKIKLEEYEAFIPLKEKTSFQKLLKFQASRNKSIIRDTPYRSFSSDSLSFRSFVLQNNGNILLGTSDNGLIVKFDFNNRMSVLIDDIPHGVYDMKPFSGDSLIYASTSPDPSDTLTASPMILKVNVLKQKISHGIEVENSKYIYGLELSKEGVWFVTNDSHLFMDRYPSGGFQVPIFAQQFDFAYKGNNLSAVAITDDNKLFVADRYKGIYKIDIESSDINLVKSGDFVTQGISNIYYYNGTLITIHDGLRPYQVKQFILDKKQKRIIEERIICRNDSILNKPSNGQIWNGAFYYIANSQNRKNQPVRIRRFNLDQ